MKNSTPTILTITEEPIMVDTIVSQITQSTTGAVVVFSGIVRGITEKGKTRTTKFLDYEAYQPMAIKKMEQVAEEIRFKWPMVKGIAIIQRIGHLEAGTPTTIIACASAHRNQGVFDAALYGIDRLKEIVPIWKKEISPDNEEWVEGRYHPEPGE